jgi:hypothetical protein
MPEPLSPKDIRDLVAARKGRAISLYSRAVGSSIVGVIGDLDAQNCVWVHLRKGKKVSIGLPTQPVQPQRRGNKLLFAHSVVDRNGKKLEFVLTIDAE